MPISIMLLQACFGRQNMGKLDEDSLLWDRSSVAHIGMAENKMAAPITVSAFTW